MTSDYRTTNFDRSEEVEKERQEEFGLEENWFEKKIDPFHGEREQTKVKYKWDKNGVCHSMVVKA